MPISAVEIEDRVADVRVTDEALEVRLRDGRLISAPISWFPRLKAAAQADRDRWELAAAGHGVHWPAIDEDLSGSGLLRTAAG